MSQLGGVHVTTGRSSCHNWGVLMSFWTVFMSLGVHQFHDITVGMS